MRTIQLISDCINAMHLHNLPAQIEIGTFKISSTGHLSNWAGDQGKYGVSIISFRLEFRPDHIQQLLDMGVKINFDTVVMAGLSESALRFKRGREAIKQGRYAPYYYMGNPDNAQTGLVENWLHATATCDLFTLKKLNAYCRENHRGHVAIDNDHNLRASGWKFKQKYPQSPTNLLSKEVAKNIRRNIAAKKKGENALLPIEKRALSQKKAEIQIARQRGAF